MANEVGKGGEEGEDQVEEIGREQVKRSCLVVVSILHAQIWSYTAQLTYWHILSDRKGANSPIGNHADHTLAIQTE